MTKLYCHCGRWVASWEPPVGGDGGQVTVTCSRCSANCADCHGTPAFRLLGPVRIEPGAARRALWRVLTGRTG
jgi:hypothetical protein